MTAQEIQLVVGAVVTGITTIIGTVAALKTGNKKRLRDQFHEVLAEEGEDNPVRKILAKELVPIHIMLQKLRDQMQRLEQLQRPSVEVEDPDKTPRERRLPRKREDNDW